jgi:hypothetical protein
MHMLDADKLLPAAPQPSQHLYLHRIGFHQASRSRPKGCNPSFRSKSAIHLCKHGHCRCVYTGHLDGEGTRSFLGAAASIIASAALIAVSEIVP